MCIDYTDINSITVSMVFPLPNIDDIFHDMENHIYYAKFDLRAGYHQLRLLKAIRYLTAFVTPDRLYELARVPFGLKNAPAVFQKALQEILKDNIPKFCRVYIDDIIVYADSEEELIQRVELILKRLKEHCVRLNASLARKKLIF